MRNFLKKSFRFKLFNKRRKKLILIFLIDIVCLFLFFNIFKEVLISNIFSFKQFFILIISLFFSGGYYFIDKPVISISNFIIDFTLKLFLVFNTINISSIILYNFLAKENFIDSFSIQNNLFLTNILIIIFIFSRYMFLILNNKIKRNFSLFIDGSEINLNKFLYEWNLINPKITPQKINYKELIYSNKEFDLALSDEILYSHTEEININKIIKKDPLKYKVFNLLDLFEKYQERIPSNFIKNNWISFQQIPLNNKFNFSRRIKRLIDISLSSILIILLSPIILTFCILIFLEDPGPVFYTQIRSGWLLDEFKIIKLRSMYQSNFTQDSEIKLTEKNDKRIMKIGKIMRKTRLDELPQLINVLKGEMSLIGPRPDLPEIDRELRKVIPHYDKRYWMQPGISGWAQVNLGFGSNQDYSKLKLSYDLYYIKNFSIWNDCIIFIKTIKTLLFVRGD